MKWICSNDHVLPDLSGGGYHAKRGPRECKSFGGWLMCKVVDRGGWLGDENSLITKLCRIGLVDANGEGGIMFWRWDFWNAWTRKVWRQP